MKRYILLFIVIALIIAVTVLILKGKVFQPAQAGLQVKSTPKSTVFLNGKSIGQTPYEESNFSAGEATLKLIPENLEGSLGPWETNIKLVGGAVTIINHEFGESENLSAGEVMTLEKISDKKTASLAVISLPDSASIKIDGESKNFTPLLLDKLTEGEREVAVSASGFIERKVRVRLVNGFKLILNVKLAQESKEEVEKEEGSSPETTLGSPERPYVEIKETPTGWLRVRLEPSASASEAGRVNPGEKYALLDEESGWYQIEYQGGEKGWISGRYAEKFE